MEALEGAFQIKRQIKALVKAYDSLPEDDPKREQIEEQTRRLFEQLDALQDSEGPVAGEQTPTVMRPQSALDQVARLGASTTQGMTFDFADELGGGAAALASYLDPRESAQSAFEGMSLPQRYRAIRDQARARDAEFLQQNPVSGLVTRMGGGAMLGSGLGAAKGGLSALVGQAARTMPIRSGVTAGLLGGYGAGQGTPGEIAESTGKGGLLGGMFGVGGRLAGMGPSGAKDRAARYVRQALRHDDMTPEAAAARINKMPEGAGLVDLGENMQRTGENLMTLPGRASNIGRQFFENRVRQAPSRVGNLMQRVLGTKQGFHDAKGEIIARLKTDAGPYYREAYASPLRMTAKLKSVFNRAKGVGAVREAKKMLDADLEATGHVALMDKIKQALDDKASSAIRAGNNNAARVYRNLAKELTDEVDAQVPSYPVARKIFQGDARLRDALDDGRDFLKLDAEEIAAKMAELSDGEQEMFRLGAARLLRDRVLGRSETADPSKAWFNKPLVREKLGQLFEPRDLAVLHRGMRSEQRMFETAAKATTNSRTAARAAGLLDAFKGPDMAADVAMGSPEYGVTRALMNWFRNHNHGYDYSPAVREELARIIFNGNPQERLALLQQVTATQAPTAVGAARAAIPLLGGPAAGLAQ